MEKVYSVIRILRGSVYADNSKTHIKFIENPLYRFSYLRFHTIMNMYGNLFGCRAAEDNRRIEDK